MAETPDMAMWRLQFRNDSLILSGTLKYMRKRQNMSNDTLQKVYNFSWLVGLLMPLKKKHSPLIAMKNDHA